MYILSSQILVLFVGRLFAKSWSSTTRLSRHGHDSTWIPGFLWFHPVFCFSMFLLHFVFTLTWKACDGRALSQQPDARFEIVRWDSTWQNVNAESWWPLRLVTETVLLRASRSSRSSSASPSSSARSRFTVLGCLLHSWHCEVCPTCGKPQAHQSKYKVELNKAFWVYKD